MVPIERAEVSVLVYSCTCQGGGERKRGKGKRAENRKNGLIAQWQTFCDLTMITEDLERSMSLIERCVNNVWNK